MPLPKPASGEQHDAFISRCMGNDLMNREYPDQSQRAAVCESQWRAKKMTMQLRDALKAVAAGQAVAEVARLCEMDVKALADAHFAAKQRIGLRTGTATLKEAAEGETPTGELEVVFSTFGIVDGDDDVIEAGAIANGKEALMVWSHIASMQIGKGLITTDAEKATWSGQLWLDTTDGAEAFKKIKHAGDLQEYSWRLIVQDSYLKEDPAAYWGYIRHITKADVVEVSPVLRGSNPQTYTVGLKSDDLDDLVERIADRLLTAKAEPVEEAQGVTLEAEIKAARAAAEQVMVRVSALAAEREKAGRNISSERQADLRGLAAELLRLSEGIKTLGQADQRKAALQALRESQIALGHLSAGE